MPERTLRFQQKLWQIVNSCHTGAVSWSDLGDSIIFKFSQFKKEYLDKNIFCKSSKIASFIRQLNLYGFRKLIKSDGYSKKKLLDRHEFQNAYFQKGRKDLLEKVVRSSTTPTTRSRISGGGRPRKRGRKAKIHKRHNAKWNKMVAVVENCCHYKNKTIIKKCNGDIRRNRIDNSVRKSNRKKVKSVFYSEGNPLLRILNLKDLKSPDRLIPKGALNKVEKSGNEASPFRETLREKKASETRESSKAVYDAKACPGHLAGNASVIFDGNRSPEINPGTRAIISERVKKSRKKSHSPKTKFAARSKTFRYLTDNFHLAPSFIADEFSNLVPETKNYFELDELPDVTMKKPVYLAGYDRGEEYFILKETLAKQRKNERPPWCLCN